MMEFNVKALSTPGGPLAYWPRYQGGLLTVQIDINTGLMPEGITKVAHMTSERYGSPPDCRLDTRDDQQAISPGTGSGVEVETSVIFPFFPGILRLLAVIPLLEQGSGQLLLGAQAHLPERRDAEGRFRTLASALGYPQYACKGLLFDAMFHVP